MRANIDSLSWAISFASIYHCDQVDKGGQPYIFHLLRVMLKGQTLEEQIIGVLHDILEDTSVTLDELRHEFPANIVARVLQLTRQPGDTYDHYISEIVDPVAMRVKLYDLEDNMDLTRLPAGFSGQLPGYERYAKTYLKIKTKLGET